MGIGENIRKLREEMKDGTKLTQEKLAEKVGVSFQAVSAWERNEYKPETENVLNLMAALDASADAILDGRKRDFETKKAIYDWEHMKTFVKSTAKSRDMRNTLEAIEFAVAAHEGQKRKNSDLPYISHPLTMACHALAMGIKGDEVIAAILLHDVIEESRKDKTKKEIKPEEIPVNDRTRDLVDLMTCDETTDDNRKEKLDDYYGKLAKDRDGALIKCLDRCNNLTTMSWGLSRERTYRMITETDRYYPNLLKVVKDTPEYNDAAWLLQYQIESMLDIYKRLM